MAAADQVIAVAMAQRGKPYVFGSAGPDTFDCSGLVVYAYKHGAGISLPHFTGTLWGKGSAISKANLAPGDLVFPNPSHVGIYIGSGQMVVAPHTGTVVQVQSVKTVWGARRIIDPGTAVGLNVQNLDTQTVGSAIPGVDQIKAIYGVFQKFNDMAAYVSDPHAWVRFGMYAAGVALILFGMWKFDTGKAVVQSGVNAVKKVGSSASA
jgi:hypothetical protein